MTIICNWLMSDRPWRTMWMNVDEQLEHQEQQVIRRHRLFTQLIDSFL